MNDNIVKWRVPWKKINKLSSPTPRLLLVLSYDFLLIIVDKVVYTYYNT